MTVMLSETARVRLSRLLAMLGSDFDGEVINAGRQADRLVRSAGVSWTDVINPSLPPPDNARWPGTDPDPAGPDWRQTAAACLRFPMLLNKWEFDFLSGLPRFPGLSKKQRDTLRNIVTRLRAAGCSL
jgi:hypothetical protein